MLFIDELISEVKKFPIEQEKRTLVYQNSLDNSSEAINLVNLIIKRKYSVGI
jgi:hypothetical protein